MDTELQRANMWKRMSAYLLDLILLSIVTVGFAFFLSAVLGYDGYSTRLEEKYAEYEAKHHIVFDISAEEYDALTESERQLYETALSEFSADSEAGYLYSMLINLTLLIITFSLLLAYLTLEFALPLAFGNGQTAGKKIFGLAVMRTDHVKITPLLLFIRTVLGKYTVETMIPVMILLMIFFGVSGIGGTLIVLALLLVQAILLIVTPTRAPIHDLLAHTVTVDLASQRIFESAEARRAALSEGERGTASE